MSICKRHLGGVLAWWEDGVLHREDGPAVVYPNGKRSNAWWYKGARAYSFKDFQLVSSCSDEYISILLLKWGKIRRDYSINLPGP